MNFCMYSELFHACVAPVMDYGAEVWGIYNCIETEKVQKTAARTFLGVKKFSPGLGIEGV